MNIIYILVLILFIVIFLSILFLKRKNIVLKESFTENSDGPTNDDYLYPIKRLTGICKKEGLFPAYMPQACYVDGNMNAYANCKCVDKEGNCKLCYPTIKRDDNNSSVIYNSVRDLS